jgi:hypothetical protein
LSKQCVGIKRDGGRCTAIVSGPSDYCYQHDPTRAEERRYNARRAGRSSGASEVRNLKRQLEELTQRVVEGSLESGRGAVAAQLINTRIRLLEYGRRLKETEELEGRMEEVEARLAARDHNERRSA